MDGTGFMLVRFPNSEVQVLTAANADWMHRVQCVHCFDKGFFASNYKNGEYKALSMITLNQKHNQNGHCPKEQRWSQSLVDFDGDKKPAAKPAVKAKKPDKAAVNHLSPIEDEKKELAPSVAATHREKAARPDNKRKHDQSQGNTGNKKRKEKVVADPNCTIGLDYCSY